MSTFESQRGAGAAFSRLRRIVSPLWLALSLLMVLVIWGNSLVPGTGSSSISLAVVEAVHGALRSLGLPYAWVTNFLVRKAAHFTEYAVLGILMAQALDPQRRISRIRVAATALACALVPSIDETIQLFVAGRSGQITDVLLDCCGAATGIILRTAAMRICGRRAAGERAGSETETR